MKYKNRAYIILTSGQKADKRAGRKNTLTEEVVEALISKPCEYCGHTDISITVDRKDNRIGHTIENCVPCCYRCNEFKINMPYEAWLHISPAVKKAIDKGLFGDWGTIPFGKRISKYKAK
jgi:hypothetical protein